MPREDWRAHCRKWRVNKTSGTVLCLPPLLFQAGCDFCSISKGGKNARARRKRREEKRRAIGKTNREERTRSLRMRQLSWILGKSSWRCSYPAKMLGLSKSIGLCDESKWLLIRRIRAHLLFDCRDFFLNTYTISCQGARLFACMQQYLNTTKRAWVKKPMSGMIKMTRPVAVDTNWYQCKACGNFTLCDIRSDARMISEIQKKGDCPDYIYSCTTRLRSTFR